MTESLIVSWKRVLVEVSAIVASILLAFAIDAWWDRVQQQADVYGQLAAILDDTRSAEQYVQKYRKLSLARQDSLRQLMDAAGSNNNQLSTRSLDELLADLGWFSEVYIMPEGSIEALVASGNIGFIESELLKKELSSWPSFLSYLRDNISPDSHFYFEVWRPYLRKNGDWNQIESVGRGMPGHLDTVWEAQKMPGLPYPKYSYGEFDHSVLLADREFRNILTQAWIVQQGIQVALEELETELAYVIPLIENEIAQY